MRALEIACQDPSLPVEIDAVKQLLTKLHDLKRLMLESLMISLQDGKILLEKLRELTTEGTLDSRPDHIKTSAEHGKHLSDFSHNIEIKQLQEYYTYLTLIFMACVMLNSAIIIYLKSFFLFLEVYLQVMIFIFNHTFFRMLLLLIEIL
jgi:hypothetical protein